VEGGVRIVIDVAGLPPGDKGFHVHSVGRCDAQQPRREQRSPTGLRGDLARDHPIAEAGPADRGI
jgi:Cu/Zn superoxide dismutase